MTDKGGLLDEGFFDAHIVRPHIIVACLLVLGIIAGIARAVMYDYFNVDPRVIVFNVVWATLSVIILLAAIAVAKETRQVRKTIRVEVTIPAIIHYASGISVVSETRDLSMGGVKLVTPDDRYLHDTLEEVELRLQSGSVCIPVSVIHTGPDVIRLMFKEMPLDKRRELVRVVMARADAWLAPPIRAIVLCAHLPALCAASSSCSITLGKNAVRRKSAPGPPGQVRRHKDRRNQTYVMSFQDDGFSGGGAVVGIGGRDAGQRCRPG
ncbi:hypothetical protein SODG_003139 [Sodalis praecaptivus]